mmetsp:Transcript_89254/g.139698  ORF Transcript_89254/g.139698 Transcript_89254/m.139698 type:complete len:90 (-) Transcript_89254:123-392(-)
MRPVISVVGDKSLECKNTAEYELLSQEGNVGQMTIPHMWKSQKMISQKHPSSHQAENRSLYGKQENVSQMRCATAVLGKQILKCKGTEE